MNAPSAPRIYELLLMAKPGDDPILGIRHILKLALRRYGLRCVQAREIAPPLKPERTQANDHNRHPSSSRINRGANPTSGGDRTGRTVSEST